MSPRLPQRLPLTAIETYETLRTEVLQGQVRPEGLGALVYHGMMAGLALILASASASPAASSLRDLSIRAMPHDRQFVRLLANMLLQTQSEVVHVY
jgi:hypothetical protein